MNTKIQVLRITPHLFRPGVWPVAYDPAGGLQIQVWRITEALEKAGISQTVLTSYIPGYPRSTQHSDTLGVECCGISLSEFFAGKLLGLTWFISIVKWLLKNEKAYDLIHIHYNHSIWCRVLTVIAHQLKIPVIVSLNTELWISNNWRWLVAGRRFNLSLWIERWTLRSSDAVIVLTSLNSARCSRQLKVEPRRIMVIPDTIDAETFRSQIESTALSDFRKRFNIPNNKKVVIYVGRIRTEKGWEDLPLIASVLEKSGAFMLVCGDGPDYHKLKKAFDDTGCHTSWNITGFLTPKEVRIALEIADILILPSRREAFGGVLLEAMALGLPCVAYSVGGIIEVAGEPSAILLCPPKDKAAFTQAIIDLLNNPGTCHELIAQGYRRVEDFSLKQAVEDTMNCYTRVLVNNRLNHK
ncbi:MAG: glycosyltransferase family 4 protein [Methylococcales bacterium]